MIEHMDQQLREWVEGVLGAVTLSLDPPEDERADKGINLYLLEVADAPALRSSRSSPLQLSLRYLMTSWADTPEEAHRLLGQLVFAAMETPEFEVELEPLPAATWMAIGAKLRPSIVLRVPLRKERPEPPVKLVRHPLVVQASSITSLQGVVLGPNDMPISGARVEIPALQLAVRADTKGRFHFPTVPTEPHTTQLRIRARGRELTLTVDPAGLDGEPLLIRFNPLEGRED